MASPLPSIYSHIVPITSKKMTAATLLLGRSVGRVRNPPLTAVWSKVPSNISLHWSSSLSLFSSSVFSTHKLSSSPLLVELPQHYKPLQLHQTQQVRQEHHGKQGHYGHYGLYGLYGQCNPNRLNETKGQRWMSSDAYTASPPDSLTLEMAVGVTQAIQLYVRHGVCRQRLLEVAASSSDPLVKRWQGMMEIFLVTQVHVLSGMGYPANEQGMAQYGMQLNKCLESFANTDDTMMQLLRDTRRSTWREVVATAFDLDFDQIPSLSIVEARSLMHAITTKMIDPQILKNIERRVAQLPSIINANTNSTNETIERHHVLQDIIVNDVYKSGKPSILETSGFLRRTPTGDDMDKAYAMLQCAMSDHEGDPLIGQYVGTAMVRMLEAAGIDPKTMMR